MSTLVDEKIREWTAGLDGKDRMISIFQHIRDIPNSLAVPMTDPKTAREQILAIGQGNCGPKHYLLADMYQKLGIEVVYVIFPFLWNDPDLRYPPKLRKLATGLPVACHLACRVRINDCWVLVDATWDLSLKQPVSRSMSTGLVVLILSVRSNRSGLPCGQRSAAPQQTSHAVTASNGI